MLYWLLSIRPVRTQFAPLEVLKYRISCTDMPKIVYFIRLMFDRLNRNAPPTLRTITPYCAIDVFKEDMTISSGENMELPICVGKDYDEHLHFTDLAKLPHVLIAGLTGFGKSMCFQNFIFWLGKSKNEVEIHAIDPKQTGFSRFIYSKNPVISVVFEENDYARKINDLVEKMNGRNALMRELGFKDIADYNATVKDDKLPYVILLIDEFQDLERKMQDGLKKLARMGRSAGVHLVLGTQNPNGVDIDPTILQQLAGIVCFRLRNKDASKRILGEVGAETLAEKGEMIFKSATNYFEGRAPICELKDFEFYQDYKEAQKKKLAAYRSRQKISNEKRGRPKKIIQN
ncbi:MAG: FtsK/SpoIIIE domain-containing protein [Bacteroidota bacterium]